MASPKRHPDPGTITVFRNIRWNPKLVDIFSQPKLNDLTLLLRRVAEKGTDQKDIPVGPNRCLSTREVKPLITTTVFSLLAESIGTPAYVMMNILMNRNPAIICTMDFLDQSCTVYPLRVEPIKTAILKGFVERGHSTLSYKLIRAGIDWIVMDGPEMPEGPMTIAEINQYRYTELLAKEYAHRLGYLMDTVYVTFDTESESVMVSDIPEEKNAHGS